MSNAEQNKRDNDSKTLLATPVVQDDDDWELPVCTLKPGDAAFETCESCQ